MPLEFSVPGIAKKKGDKNLGHLLPSAVDPETMKYTCDSSDTPVCKDIEDCDKEIL